VCARKRPWANFNACLEGEKSENSQSVGAGYEPGTPRTQTGGASTCTVYGMFQWNFYDMPQFYDTSNGMTIKYLNFDTSNGMTIKYFNFMTLLTACL
jgi:hypothetical protein